MKSTLLAMYLLLATETCNSVLKTSTKILNYCTNLEIFLLV